MTITEKRRIFRSRRFPLSFNRDGDSRLQTRRLETRSHHKQLIVDLVYALDRPDCSLNLGLKFFTLYRAR